MPNKVEVLRCDFVFELGILELVSSISFSSQPLQSISQPQNNLRLVLLTVPFLHFLWSYA